jgi:hypothetical protein
VKTTDELLAVLAKLKGEPAPEYVYDETGIANHALQVREQRRRREWYEELNDELPSFAKASEDRPEHLARPKGTLP